MTTCKLRIFKDYWEPHRGNYRIEPDPEVREIVAIDLDAARQQAKDLVSAFGYPVLALNCTADGEILVHLGVEMPQRPREEGWKFRGGAPKAGGRLT